MDILLFFVYTDAQDAGLMALLSNKLLTGFALIFMLLFFRGLSEAEKNNGKSVLTGKD